MNSKAALAALAFGLQAAGDPPLRLFEAVEPHMGTLVQIKLYASSSEKAAQAFRAAFDRIAAIDRELTDYQPDSELNRISRSAAGHWQTASEDLFTVLERSQQIAEETDGAFDVTIGALSHLWREARRTGHVPDADAIAKAKEHVGYRKLHLNPIDRTVYLDQSGMQLDVGGIAKGYAADQALAVIESLGVKAALVAASGDLAFSDAPPGKKGWTIAVDGAGPLVLRYAAVSTSGDAEQHIDVDGKRYSHVIDAHTGEGLTNRLSVTVVARRGIDADVADTAVDVMGVDAGLRFLERHDDWAGVLVQRDGSEVTRIVQSRRFRSLGHAGEAK